MNTQYHYGQPNGTPPLSFTQQIAIWNNLAVSHMLQDNAAEAITTLRIAVASVRDAIGLQVIRSLGSPVSGPNHDGALFHQQQHPVDVNKTLSSCQVSALQTNSPCLQVAPFGRVSLKTGLASSEMDSEDDCSPTSSGDMGVFAFFDRAYIFTDILQIPEPCDEASLLKLQNRLLTVLLYNMALYHHLQGIRFGKSGELQTALRIYELVLNMVQTSVTDFEEDNLLLLVLSLFNNQGHIHSNYFSNVHKTQTYVAWLQGAFAARHSSTMMDSDDYEFFHRYLFMTPDLQFSLAPAA